MLVGGRSRRMGRAKSRLTLGGVSLLRRACDLLRPVTVGVAILGDDEQPRDVSDVAWLDDVPEARGPLAGILAALDSDSTVDWLIVGCDMPAFDRRALDWLIRNHDPRATAAAARLPGCDRPEPLLAIYTPLAGPGLRAAVASGDFAMYRALANLRPHVVPAPPDLAGQWRNANTPEEFEAILKDLDSKS